MGGGLRINLEEAMVKTNTNFWRLFRSSTAAGLVLLLVLAGWPPTVAAKIRSDWSRVQRVTPGTRTTVLLYKDSGLTGGCRGYGKNKHKLLEAIQEQHGRRARAPAGFGWLADRSRGSGPTGPGCRESLREPEPRLLYKDRSPGSRRHSEDRGQL